MGELTDQHHEAAFAAILGTPTSGFDGGRPKSTEPLGCSAGRRPAIRPTPWRCPQSHRSCHSSVGSRRQARVRAEAPHGDSYEACNAGCDGLGPSPEGPAQPEEETFEVRRKRSERQIKRPVGIQDEYRA